MFSLIWTRINGWVNNGEAGDLRRRRAHYDVTVMIKDSWRQWRNKDPDVVPIFDASEPSAQKRNLPNYLMVYFSHFCLDTNYESYW